MSNLSDPKTIIDKQLIEYFKNNCLNNEKEISDEIQYGYKLNRYILEVLTSTLQECIQKRYSIEDLCKDIEEEKNNQFLKECQKFLKKYKPSRNGNYPNDLKNFDISACCAIVRNILCENPKYKLSKPVMYPEWNNIDINKININNIDIINIADAFNYARNIRNDCFGHQSKFEVDKDRFEKIKKLITSIVGILKIDKQNEINIIENTQIVNANDILKQYIEFSNQQFLYSFENEVFKFKNLIDIKAGKWILSTKNIYLNLLYISQCFIHNEKKYLSFDAEYIIHNQKHIEEFLIKNNNIEYLCIHIFLNDGSKIRTNLSIITEIFDNIILIGDFSEGTGFEKLNKPLITVRSLEDQSIINLFQKKIKFQKNMELDELIGLSSDNKSDIINQIKNNDTLKNIVDLFSEDQIEKMICIKDSIDLEIEKSEFEFESNEKNYYIKRKLKRFYIRQIEDIIIKIQIESIDENEMLNLNNDVEIITDEAGKGKSFVLKKFIEIIKESDKSKSQFYLFIPLNRINDVMTIKDNDEYKNDKFKFILKELVKIKSHLQISILEYLANNKNLILLLDGFDEVLQDEYDYQTKTISLIKDLLYNYKQMRVIITSRVHLQSKLEKDFSIISYSLNDFSSDDTVNFMEKFKIPKDFYCDFSYFIPEFSDFDFFKVPIHCRMLAEIFQQNPNEKLTFFNNISLFYEEFIKAKLTEKIKYRDESSQIEKSMKKEEINFYKLHYHFAFKRIFGHKFENGIEESEKNEIIEYGIEESEKNEIIEYGIITNIDEKQKPTFSHDSFAEFIVANYYMNEYKDGDNSRKEILKEILYQKNHNLIRKFINGFIGAKKDETEKNPPSNKKQKTCLSLLSVYS